MKAQISLRMLVVVVGIFGTTAGVYLRSVQPKPIRYVTLTQLLTELDLEEMEIIRCAPDLEDSRFEIKDSSTQFVDFSQHPGANMTYTVRNRFGVAYTLSEQADFVDVSRAHVAFLVRPEDGDVCHWLILKRPTWTELKSQKVRFRNWYFRNPDRHLSW